MRSASKVLLAFSLLFLSGCMSTKYDNFTRSDGASGPLTVELVNFDIARLGSRRDAQYIAQMLFSVANNSHDDVTVKKISITQRGLTTVDLMSPAKAFNTTIPSSLAEDFSMEAQVQVAGRTDNLAEKIRLAMVVEVLLTTNDAYEYTFEVAVDPSDVGR